ncbi:MAG TPA: CPBP family intramembrane glutamic endopeptidase [Longimicrobiales bacterium]
MDLTTRGFFVGVMDWRRAFYAHGRLRAGWRALLFIALFVALSVVFAGAASLAAPVDGVGALAWQGFALLAAALLAGWLLMRRLEHRPAGALGFAWTSHSARELGLGLAVGGVPLLLGAGALALAGWVGYRPEAGDAGSYVASLAGALLALAVAAAWEEAVFRGYPFQVLVEALGPVAATIMVSAAFAAAHAGNPDVGVFALLNIFLAGVLLSVAYLRTRSLWFATAVHLGWNWTMGSVLDLPVSGLQTLNTPLYEPVVSGPPWITGGNFGPEGGLVGSAAFALALLAVARLPTLEEAPEMRALGPLVDRRLHVA